MQSGNSCQQQRVSVLLSGLPLAVVVFVAAFMFIGCDGGVGVGDASDTPRSTLDQTVLPDDTGGADDVVTPGGVDDGTPGLTLTFSATSSFCCDPLSIDFTVDLSDPRVKARTVFEWDFGDGRTATGAALTHTYAWAGSYLVTLTAFLPDGLEQTARQMLSLAVEDDGITDIDMTPTPAPPDTGSSDSAEPVADAGPDKTVYVGEQVSLGDDAALEIDDADLRYIWVQRAGEPAELSGVNEPVATFVAPEVTDPFDVLTFQLVVSKGDVVAWDDVAVTVRPVPEDEPLDDDDDSDEEDQDDPPSEDEDADADGLPDQWEITYFDDVAIWDGTDNPDGDLADNLLEYRYGTDPTVPDSQQVLLNLLSDSVQAFERTGGRFTHAVDGPLVGWPMVKTVDEIAPPFWGVDDYVVANQPLISMMGPGTPDAGLAFLEAFEATGNKLFLEYAIEAAKTLLSVQRDLETHPDGSARDPLTRGGWINYAAIILDNEDTRGKLPSEIGHWSAVSVTNEIGDVEFVSREGTYMKFDDSVSTHPAMFLLELYNVIRRADFSDEVVDPLAGMDKEAILVGATKFFALADGYRRDFAFQRADFEDVYIKFRGENPDKSGPHPFIAYLESIPDHPLNRGQTFKPYADGGLPHGVVTLERFMTWDGAAYGARAAGHILHKHVNDDVLSTFLLFLLRYYEVTGDAAALDNLDVQMTWLVDVFAAYGNRGWCQQYHVLDNACAPSRPWEPPALAMSEGIRQIVNMGLVERWRERTLGVSGSGVRRTLEDAVYYVHRVAPRDDADLLFRYYALSQYDANTVPSGYPAISANDPLFACDYYYPDDPYTTCQPPYDQLGFQMYRIDERSHAAFVSPIGEYMLNGIGDERLYRFMIAQDCLDNTAATDYDGCLDLNKEYADLHGFWLLNDRFWGSCLDVDIAEYLHAHLPDADGHWTSTRTLNARQRVVIDTQDFTGNVRGVARMLLANPGEIADADSDGLVDHDEGRLQTDPYHPDSDGDGCFDGDEVTAGTDPLDSTSHP